MDNPKKDETRRKTPAVIRIPLEGDLLSHYREKYGRSYREDVAGKVLNALEAEAAGGASLLLRPELFEELDDVEVESLRSRVAAFAAEYAHLIRAEKWAAEAERPSCPLGAFSVSVTVQVDEDVATCVNWRHDERSEGTARGMLEDLVQEAVDALMVQLRNSGQKLAAEDCEREIARQSERLQKLREALGQASPSASEDSAATGWDAARKRGRDAASEGGER